MSKRSAAMAELQELENRKKELLLSLGHADEYPAEEDDNSEEKDYVGLTFDEKSGK